jgi:hypothetical protein
VHSARLTLRLTTPSSVIISPPAPACCATRRRGSSRGLHSPDTDAGAKLAVRTRENGAKPRCRTAKIQSYCVLCAHFGVRLAPPGPVHATAAGGRTGWSGAERPLMGSKPSRLRLGAGRFRRILPPRRRPGTAGLDVYWTLRSRRWTSQFWGKASFAVDGSRPAF